MEPHIPAENLWCPILGPVTLHLPQFLLSYISIFRMKYVSGHQPQPCSFPVGHQLCGATLVLDIVGEGKLTLGGWQGWHNQLNSRLFFKKIHAKICHFSRLFASICIFHFVTANNPFYLYVLHHLQNANVSQFICGWNW